LFRFLKVRQLVQQVPLVQPVQPVQRLLVLQQAVE
jgi:hypothetical protein